MTPYIDVFIQKETNCDRQYLLDRVRDAELGIDASVVYIYALADECVNYPEKPGNVIYIGEAGRPSEPTGKRFAQHVSTSSRKGGDSGTIYSLSRYYWQGKRLRLQVFLVESSEERKKAERILLNSHVKEFGSLPICQGTTGENYGTTALSSLVVPEKFMALFFPTSNNSHKPTPQSSVA